MPPPPPPPALPVVIRSANAARPPAPESPPEAGRPMWRRVLSAVLTAASLGLVWIVLLLPYDVRDLEPRVFARVPLEGLALVGLLDLLGRRWRRPVVLLAGVVLGVIAVVEVLDLASNVVLGRPVDLVNDWTLIGPGYELLVQTSGMPAAIGIAVLTVLAVPVVVGLVLVALYRTAEACARRRRIALSAVAVLLALGMVATTLDWEVSSRAPVASWNTPLRLGGKLSQARDALADRDRFRARIAADPLADVPSDRLLAGLRGKDVLLVFVESYGRSTIENPDLAPEVDALLDTRTRQLDAAGLDSRSAFLTSTTYGAGSWLAHASMQSGLEVDSQYRYNQLLRARRQTLTRLFGEAGWRTVVHAPATTRPWPEGERFYGFDKLNRSDDLGYRGPSFGFSPMPDQYALAAFERSEWGSPEPGAEPVMAQIDLTSSHHPWTLVPEVLPDDEVGDGSAYRAKGPSQEELFGDPAALRAAYTRSITYSVGSLLSFVERRRDRDLVVLMVGDHQPHGYISGAGAGRDVPISIIARDPAVLDRVDGWGWEPGLNPSPEAPVSPMASFRDRFVDAFSQP
ncbi:MAG: sulfatase-like hydrolase/transferase [Nocardioides sp.]